jgi:hypothetical protein
MAAAAYDLFREEATRAGAAYASVELSTTWHRVLLCEVVLDGDAPAALREAIDDTIEVLRGIWITLLLQDDADVRRRLDSVHAAIQHDVAATERAWVKGIADPRLLARRLADRRDAHRDALAHKAPHGVGILIAQKARATEPYPSALCAAKAGLDTMLATIDVMRACETDESALALLVEDHVVLEHVAFGAIGAWRLGEIEGELAAREIEAHVSAVHERLRTRASLRPTAPRAPSIAPRVA